MDQTARRRFLIDRLLCELPKDRRPAVPTGEKGEKDLLRALMNVRPAADAPADFLAVQDDYLKEAIAEKGVTDASALSFDGNGCCVWQGDITTLCCDAIVNAANSGMTGCYRPLHTCIDNCIHTYAGVQLRKYCDGLMKAQGHEEPTGLAKITPAFNLPCKYVLHTVGPIVSGPLTDEHRALLASCYTSCLALADENGCKTVAFCCISTGVFGYPKEAAAQTAIDTVKAYKERTNSAIKVIFNVFGDEDRQIYTRLLGR